LAVLLVGWACAASLPAFAAPVARRSTGDDYTFAFQNAEITQVAQEVLGAIGQPYAIDPAVTGKVTFRIEQRLTREQLLATLEAVLAANGVSVVRNGDQLFLTPDSKAKTSATVRRASEGLRGAGYQMVAIPLAYAQPSEVAHALEAISAANTVLYSNDKLGLLLLGGNGDALKSAIEALKVFDQSAFENSKIRWFELSQAPATTVAGELERIVQGSGLVGVSVIPLKRLNGVIVFGRSAASLDELAKWILRLDTPGKEVASTLWVYHPRSSAAEDLAKSLNSILGAQARVNQTAVQSPPPSSPSTATPGLRVTTTEASAVFGSGDDEVRVGIDKDTNTLLIVAPAPRWVQIQRILNEIDRPPRQVLIEASILEVTLDKELQFGVDWSVISDDLTVSAINNSQGAVGPSFPGLSVTYVKSDLKAAVNALGSKTDVEVVSAPKIVVLDNHTAHLQVGDQVPVLSQSAQSTVAGNAPLVSTVNYQNTGVLLTVTPRISGDDQLVLDVAQEVSNVTKTVSSGINSPTIQQRRFESTLEMRDGGVVALGGLISSNHSVSDSGVPYLKDVPVLGALFKSQGHSATRNELVVLLTARIMSDAAGSDRAMKDLVADMRELQGRGLLPPHH
jgi:general secretion pathway protein D